MSKSIDSLKEQIEQKQGTEGFIKVTEKPLGSLSSEQKVTLNRRGNVLFNQGDIEGAKRIFTTTGYSDGLTRVGDFYKSENRQLDALKEYNLAHNKSKAEPMYESLANVIRQLLKDE